MAEVISTGYEAPYKVGDKYLDVSATDLKRAKQRLDDLIKANKEDRIKEFIGVQKGVIEDMDEIQEVINALLRLKKDYTGPQGQSMHHMQINTDKAKTIHNALVLLKQYQDIIKTVQGKSCKTCRHEYDGDKCDIPIKVCKCDDEKGYVDWEPK